MFGSSRLRHERESRRTMISRTWRVKIRVSHAPRTERSHPASRGAGHAAAPQDAAGIVLQPSDQLAFGSFDAGYRHGRDRVKVAADASGSIVKAICLLSGGLDSSTCLGVAKREG